MLGNCLYYLAILITLIIFTRNAVPTTIIPVLFILLFNLYRASLGGLDSANVTCDKLNNTANKITFFMCLSFS